MTAFAPLFNLQRLRRPRTWLAGSLLGLLLALQTLGLVHGIAHAARHQTAASVQKAGSLFGVHDAGGVDCQLYDQLAHGDLAAPAAIGWASAPLASSPFVDAHAGLYVPPTRRFGARDPPAALA